MSTSVPLMRNLTRPPLRRSGGTDVPSAIILTAQLHVRRLAIELNFLLAPRAWDLHPIGVAIESIWKKAIEIYLLPIALRIAMRTKEHVRRMLASVRMV